MGGNVLAIQGFSGLSQAKVTDIHYDVEGVCKVLMGVSVGMALPLIGVFVNTVRGPTRWVSLLSCDSSHSDAS